MLTANLVAKYADYEFDNALNDSGGEVKPSSDGLNQRLAHCSAFDWKNDSAYQVDK